MTDRLETLAGRIRSCRVCVDEPISAPLPHEPRPVLSVSWTARLCVCGQAPGSRVHQTGIPFNDPSGDRLRAWMGVTRDEFYDEARVAIVPMGFCFPGTNGKGGDLPPRKECPPTWRAELFDALPRFDLILLIGQYAQKWHLGGDAHSTLTETVADWRRYAARQDAPRHLPLPHPSWRNTAWLKRNPWFEEEVVPYLRAEVRKLL
jgi:uracil-DNA glycosylase